MLINFIILIQSLTGFVNGDGLQKKLTQQGVTIEIERAQCQIPSQAVDNNILVISVSNSNSYAVEVSWNFSLQYNSTCYNCDSNNLSPEFARTIQVPANSQVSGECSFPADRELTIFHSFNNIDHQVSLNNIDLFDIDVKQLQINH